MIFKKWENWLTYEITAGTFVNQGFHVAWFSQQIRLPCLCLSIKLNCEESKIRFHAKCYLRIFFLFNSAGYDLQKIQLKKSNGNFHSSSIPVYILSWFVRSISTAFPGHLVSVKRWLNSEFQYFRECQGKFDSFKRI